MPAVLISHGLGGLRDSRERVYGAMLAQNGYVALAIDSFKSRGAAKDLEAVRALKVTESMILADAFAGLRYLAARPDVDENRIYIMGFSYGGMIAVLGAYEQLAEMFLPGGPRFAGHVSYYGCSVPRLESPVTTGAPVTVMVGAKDYNVCIDRTREIAKDLERGGSKTDLIVFPEAYHQWDSADDWRPFVRFSLAPCRMRVDPEGEVRCERFGLRIAGPASRTLILSLTASWKGYYMYRNAETHKRSNEILLNALSRD